jgi:surfeit locus 1 family protein
VIRGIAAEQYNVADTLKKKLLGWLPYALGVLLVVQFAGLGVWQIERGLGKLAQRREFAGEVGFAAWSDGMPVRSFQKLEVTGRLDTEHQILLENIIIEDRLGYYVLTPLVVSDGAPVLIVNRGWIERTAGGFDPASIAAEPGRVTLHGRAGSLPKAGYRMGDAFKPGEAWPQTAVYPTLDEVSAALGRDVQPFVLLLDPDDPHGFFRYWEPAEMGPGRHFAYALQWFAMGAVLAFLLVRNFRKRGLES